MRWSSHVEIVDVRELAVGGFGKVYRANLVGRNGIRHGVILKVPYGKDAGEFRAAEETLLQESRILSMISHPNIVRSQGYLSVGMDCAAAHKFNQECRGQGQVHDVPMLVLEDAGTSLERVLQAFGGRMDEALAAHIATELLKGLGHLHELAIVHRDIKPSNILIGRNGEVKLGDLGIAKDDDSPTTKTGHLKGTVFYMSPEALFTPKPGELRVKLDGRADIWAVGVLLYKMVSGGYPWRYARGGDGSSLYFEWLQRVEHEPIEELPEEQVSKALFGVIRKCLAKNRDQRYADASEVIEALRPVSLPAHACAAQLAYRVRTEIERSEPDPSSLPGAITVPVNGNRRSPANARDDEQELVSFNIIVPRDMQEDSYDSMSVAKEPSSALMSGEVTARVVAGERPAGAPRRSRGRLIAFGAFAASLLMGVVGWWALSQQQVAAKTTSTGQQPSFVAAAEHSNDKQSQPEKGTRTSSVDVAVSAAPLAERKGEAMVALAATDQAAVEGHAGSKKTSEVRANESTAAADPSASSDEAAEKHAKASVGTLEVVVLPRGAFVSLDGQPPVTAPVTFEKLKTGTHSLRLGMAADALERTERVKVKAGPNRFRVVLSNPFGE